jgi:phenylacetate-CoA ligase
MHPFLAGIIYHTAAEFRKENTFSLLKEFRASQNWDYDKLHIHQEKTLANLIQNVRVNIPFYNNYKTFNECPVVDRAILLKNKSAFQNLNVKKRLTKKSTSGSTGEPLVIYKDNISMGVEQAVAYRCYERFGVKPGDRQARFWGMPLGTRYKLTHMSRDYILNRKRFVASNYSDETFWGYFQKLKKINYCYVYGYSSIIATFSLFLLKNKLNITNVKAVITTAEILTNEMRTNIESALNAKVYNEYGCSEAGVIACDASDGKMYINSDSVYVEVIDKEGNINTEGAGELLITDMYNFYQPLIRYKLGDFVEIQPPDQKSLYCFPTIKSIQGRIRDTIIGKNGKEYYGVLITYIINKAQTSEDQILEYQVVQDANTLLIKIIRGQNFSEEVEKNLRLLIEKEFDGYFICLFEYCDQTGMEREKNGKKKLIKRIG